MMKFRLIAVISMIIIVTACSGSISNRRSSPWGNYDYRHPVPGEQTYQSNYYNEPYIDDLQQHYRDNDEFYTPPSNFGCSPDNITLCR